MVINNLISDKIVGAREGGRNEIGVYQCKERPAHLSISMGLKVPLSSASCISCIFLISFSLPGTSIPLWTMALICTRRETEHVTHWLHVQYGYPTLFLRRSFYMYMHSNRKTHGEIERAVKRLTRCMTRYIKEST